jgi:hypothetical protein
VSFDYRFYVCIDNEDRPHDWYRAPGLDVTDEQWHLQIAKALPENMYLGRVDANGCHQWLSMTSPGFWVWWNIETDQPPVLHMPPRRK